MRRCYSFTRTTARNVVAPSLDGSIDRQQSMKVSDSAEIVAAQKKTGLLSNELF